MPKHHQKSINKAPLAQGIFFYLKSCLETTKNCTFYLKYSKHFFYLRVPDYIYIYLCVPPSVSKSLVLLRVPALLRDSMCAFRPACLPLSPFLLVIVSALSPFLSLSPVLSPFLLSVVVPPVVWCLRWCNFQKYALKYLFCVFLSSNTAGFGMSNGNPII